jgi:hypothetical protein
MSNVPGVNSPIGEVSAYGLSFSREVGTYEDPTIAGFTLYNFKSATDGQTGATIQMPGALVNSAIGLIQFLVNNVTGQSGQVFADELLADLVDYGATHSINNISLGEVKQFDQVWAPEWIKFKRDSLQIGSDTNVDNENTIWLSNEAFETQYDEYQIVVVPPIDNLDLFFGTGTSVLNMIHAITTPQIIDRIQLYKGGYPSTVDRSDEYDYINALNSAQTVKVNWPVIIYGPAGNNIDAIKDALIEYILAHSSHNRNDWSAIFPDIFKRTEFVIAPLWHKYAIENRTQAAGVYSPVATLVEMDIFVKKLAPEYPTQHVSSNAQTVGWPYRSLNLAIVGGPDNREQKFKFSDIFPDYINVSSTSTDFNRMDPATVTWALAVADMIIRAETMNKYTVMPQGLMKMERDGILYIVKTFNNIQFLVATKRSTYEQLGLTYE